MIREARFTEGGEYRIENDHDRSAALLSTLKCMAGIGGSSTVDELRETARKIVHDVEQAHWKIAVLYHVEGREDETLRRDINILTKVVGDSHSTPEMWARDGAADMLYDWANDQGLAVQVQGTTVLSRNDR